MRRGSKIAALFAAAALAATTVLGADAAQRIRSDAAAGRPLVAHVVVALCDNLNQGIVPVPKALGNGQDPARNLYWGARYGVKTYFAKTGGWKQVPIPGAGRDGVLDR